MLPPELWGGVECTVNRVHDRYLDQLVLTGHDKRLDDLDLLRDLGIKTVRYTVVWERIEPSAEDSTGGGPTNG